MVAQLMLITLVAMPFSKRPTMRNLLFMLPGIIVCFTLLAIVVFTPLGKNVIVPRMTLMFDLESVSSRWRLGEYQLAFEAIKHHPWIGNGIGMWPRYRGIDKAGYAPPNTYLHILFEAGLFGLIVAMLMVGQLYHILFRALRGCVPEKRPHLQACLISLTGFLLTGMVYDVKYLIAFWPFIGLYLAMAKAYGYGSDDSVC